jgi:nitric oxide reductase subunit B
MQIQGHSKLISMVRLTRTSIPTSHYFILTGLILLASGMIFGFIGGLQYVIQGFIKTVLSFDKVRPLHVSSVVFWIILGAVGSVMTYLQQHTGT